jgi:hypothetical protein
MCKFVVLYGKNTIPGLSGTSYEIYDLVTFDPKKDIENQMRKYVFKEFHKRGKNPWKLRKEVFCRRRHIFFGDGRIFAERTKIFDHENTNEFFCFVPKECFEF